MKTFAAGLAAHYALPTTSLAAFLEVQRADGVFVRFTGADVDVVVDGQTYLTAAGLNVSDLSVSAGAAVDSMQLTIFPDRDIPESDLLSGLWDFSRFRIFEANYLDPAGGINVLRRGWTGKAEAARLGYTIELRSLKQAWQQSVGAVTSKTCRARLGDEKCLVNLAPWTRTYATTAVASRHVVTCAAALEASDYFGEGTATGLTGPNIGHRRKVKSFAAGVFTFSLAFPFTIGVGDTFRFVAGCRKRLEPDCKVKFGNVLNNQSEPHVPGADKLMADPDVAGP